MKPESTPLLVVDDNPINLKLMRILLNGEGFNVTTAANAVEAQAALKVFTPALVLMDLQMPGMDGLELTRRLKADPKTKGIPVVAITAYAMSGDDMKAKEAGCDAYVAKPIDTRTLPRLLHDLIHEKSKTN
jgi:CheY-like chemotaxis protein